MLNGSEGQGRNRESPVFTTLRHPDFEMNSFFMARGWLKTGALSALALLGGLASPALADKIKHPTAVFSGLDKITGRIISFEVAIDETVQFGALQITARVCYTRPATEAPQTTTFAEVDEVTTTNEYKRIFSGWMYAASPGLHGIEHPVYDIWLTDCKGGSTVIVEKPEVSGFEAAPPANATDKPPKPGTVPRPRRVQPVDPVDPTLPPAQAGEPAVPSLGGPIQVGPPPGGRPTPPANLAPSRPAQPRYNAPAPMRDPAGN